MFKGKILEHITSQEKRGQAGAQVDLGYISQIPNVDPIAPVQVKFSTHVSTKGLPTNNKFPHTTCSKRKKKTNKQRYSRDEGNSKLRPPTQPSTDPGIYAYEVYSKGCGGCGSSSTAMADDPDPCWPAAGAVLPVLPATVVGASVSARSSASVGCRSRRRMNPEGAGFTGTYRLFSRNLMNFSCAGITRAGFVRS